MTDPLTALTSDELSREVAELGQRLDQLRAARDGAALRSDELLQDLESAHEELRVADEEVRVQQEQIRQAMNGQRAERMRHERLLAMVPVPVMVTDGHGVVLSANGATAALLHTRVDRLVGKPLTVFVDESDRPDLRRELSRTALAAAGAFRRLVSLTPRRGDPVQAELVASAARDEERQVTRITVLVLVGHHGSTVSTLDARAVAQAFTDLTRLPLEASSTEHLLTGVTEICERALGPGAAVSVTLGNPAEPDVVATSSKLAQYVDGRQMVAGEGPCVSAWETGEHVATNDLANDGRWPRLAQHLGDVPVQSAVAVPVRGADGLVGALNVYRQPGADFETADGEELSQMVDLLGGAVSALLQEVEVRTELEESGRDLAAALSSRATIDQAKGMIMAIRGCDADDAFALLVELSSLHNVKLRDIAARMVATTSRGEPLHGI